MSEDKFSHLRFDGLCITCGQPFLMESHEALVAALKKTVWELNIIRARDGVPYTYDGYKASVCPEYFSSVVDEGFAALAAAGEKV